MAGEDENEGRNRDDEQMHYNSTNLSSDWPFNASNDLTNTSMAMVTSSNPMNNGSKDIPLPVDCGTNDGSQPKNDARQGGSGFSGNNLLGESEYSEGKDLRKCKCNTILNVRETKILRKAFLQIQDETQSKQLLFPHERGVVPCELLSELLQYATILEANNGCRDRFELRIGKQMKTVSGKIVSTKPVNLSKAANILSNFVTSDNGASQSVSAYLRRASVAFNELVYFKRHHKLKKKPNEEASTISDLSHRNLEEYEARVRENDQDQKVAGKIEGKMRKKEKEKKIEGSLGSGKNENVEVECEEGNEMVKRKSEDKKKKKKKRKNAEVDGGENGNLEASERKKRRRIEADE
ncbi:hypothetical protein L2E82_33799 [Cichorium intybus]|uniref:Uncharacterized protein n=1 Tax=Cichorium intybus TaxID=13427 RepID=A0ACB9BL80_CICIN|nr:hypothetical protein L2E82_33799 [Cichorium intybus]